MVCTMTLFIARLFLLSTRTDPWRGIKYFGSLADIFSSQIRDPNEAETIAQKIGLDPAEPPHLRPEARRLLGAHVGRGL